MSFLPPEGPGAEDARPSGWEAVIEAVLDDEVTVIIPALSTTRTYGPARYAAPGRAVAVGDPCTVVFTDGQPFVLVEGTAEHGYAAVTGVTPVIGTGVRATDIANLQGAIDAMGDGGAVHVWGDLNVDGITIPPDKPVHLKGLGPPMKHSNTPGADYGGTRLRRSQGTATVLSALSSNWLTGRGYLDLENLEISGGGLGGAGLLVDRGNSIHIDNVRITDCGGSGVILREIFNSDVSNLYIAVCGSATEAALLFDYYSEAQGATDILNFDGLQFIGCNGSEIRATGNATSGPTADLSFVNVTMEGHGDAALPFIDLDYAVHTVWANTTVGVTSAQTAVPIKIGTSGPGSTLPHQFSNLSVYSGNAGFAPPYIVQLANQNLQIANFSYIAGAGDVGTALVRIESTVNAGGVQVNGVNTNSGKPILSDARSAPAAYTAASTVTLRETDDLAVISGTTTIDTIANPRRGRRVTLITLNAVTLSAAGNLKLPGGSVSMTADDSITLVGTGSQWYAATPAVAI
jgi:hypothetical protein